jgi:pyruvate kinase
MEVLRAGHTLAKALGQSVFTILVNKHLAFPKPGYGVASLAPKDSHRLQFGAKSVTGKIALSHPEYGW